VKACRWLRVVAGACLVLLALGACGGASRRNGSSGSGDGGSAGAAGNACLYGGGVYQVEDTFPADDGCNTCRCTEEREVSCGLIPCKVCRDLEAQHAALLEQSKTCDPNQPNPCNRRVLAELTSGCMTFGTTPMEQGSFFAYYDLGCVRGSELNPSCPIPVSASCSSAGRCVDSFEPEPGAACRSAGGPTYPSGSTDVPDPFGCTGCLCSDGTLFCYDFSCDEACPEPTTLGSRCAECGASGECLVVERDCYLKCTSESCEASPCVDEICIDTCQ